MQLLDVGDAVPDSDEGLGISVYQTERHHRAGSQRTAESPPVLKGWRATTTGPLLDRVKGRVKAVESAMAVASATLEAARSSIRGGGGAPSGRASLWEYRAAPEPPGAP